MSFSSDVKSELLEAQIKKNCCKKAFLVGMLMNARRLEKTKFESVFLDPLAQEKIAELIKLIYRTEPSLSLIHKPGKVYHAVSFVSSSFSQLIESVDSDPDVTISEAVPFKCPLCEQVFLRGTFISCGKLSDPAKCYNLEFSLSKENLSRASKLYRFLSLSGFVPKIVNRSNTSGLYFKSNQTISDILYLLGAVKPSFKYLDASIEREIVNTARRKTNCETGNILKTVDASKKHIDAINKLIMTHKLDSLPQELKVTAKIRIENPEASLTLLAALHNPPISKSGLNHRLDKICGEAEIIED